jgi:hypothetical protein
MVESWRNKSNPHHSIMVPSGQAPEAPQQGAHGQVHPAPGTTQNVSQDAEFAVPANGRRPALQHLGRYLDDGDLAHPGVQKMLLDRVDSAELECSDLRGFVERYHEADKRAAVLEAQLRTSTAFEVLSGAGFALGGVLVGVGPSLFDTHFGVGLLVMGCGLLFMAASILGRIVHKSK